MARGTRRSGCRRFLLVSLAVLAGAEPASAAATRVSSPSELAAAIARYRHTGGTIVLAPGRYPEIRVGPRGSRALVIKAERGASAGRVSLDRTRSVSLVGLRISPRTAAAQLTVSHSSGVVLDRIVVAGTGPRLGANVQLWYSRRVTIRRSRFTQCGEKVACLLPGRSNLVRLIGNRFHDCRGCDFLRGIFGRTMLIRGNRFDRALVGPCGRDPLRCNHQDLIEIQGGRGLVVERNRFGLYEIPGGGQLYLVGRTSDVLIRNNLFLPTDSRVPGVRSRVGINLGGRSTVPKRVVIVNNTVLTGKPRHDKNVATSVRFAPGFKRVAHADRPIFANNVLRLAASPELLCAFARESAANVVMRGEPCSETDVLGDPHLTSRGRPTADSLLTIDLANPRWAPPRDFLGIRRDAAPDIGAFELVTARGG